MDLYNLLVEYEDFILQSALDDDLVQMEQRVLIATAIEGLVESEFTVEDWERWHAQYEL